MHPGVVEFVAIHCSVDVQYGLVVVVVVLVVVVGVGIAAGARGPQTMAGAPANGLTGTAGSSAASQAAGAEPSGDADDGPDDGAAEE